MKRLLLTLFAFLLLAGQAWGADLTVVSGKMAEYRTTLSDADVRVKLTDRPRIESSKWNGEAYLHLTYEAMDVSLITAALTDSVASAKVGGKTVKVWALGDDVLEMSLTFATLTDVPKAIELKIEDSGNLQYLYQPELTQAEKDEGCYRPPNVVGSYAVYIRGKANNQYKTGKLCHLYRWEAIGAGGKKVWLDPLKIDKGKLIIGVPDLSGMAFPVVCMGAGHTLGYATRGLSSSSSATNRTQIGGPWTLAADATMTEIHSWHIDSIGDADVQMGIYDDNAGTPNLLKYSSGSYRVTDAVSPTETKFTGLSVALTAGVHYVGTWNDIASGYYYDIDAAVTWRYKNTDQWPSPWNQTGFVAERKQSTWIVYSSEAPPRRNRITVTITDAWRWLRQLLLPQAWAWRVDL